MRCLAILSLLIVLAGCGQPPGKLPEEAVLDREKRAEEVKKGDARQVESEGGEITIFSEDDKEPLWKVAWKNAVLDYEPGNSKFGGRLGLTEGAFFENGKEVSHFKAKEAFTKPGSRVLRLVGGVEIISQGGGKSPNGRVFCQEAVYDADSTKIIAKGPLRVEFMGYVMTGVDEVWAWRDLSLVATPDQFGR